MSHQSTAHLLLMKEKGIDIKGIRNIIFDLGGVLVDLHRQQCLDAFEKIGIQKVAYYVREGRVEDFFYDSEVGAINREGFCDKVRRNAESNASDEEIVWAWNQLLGEIADDKKEMLLQLKKHFRLFLLSNTNDMHWNYCCDNLFGYQGHGVDDYFEYTYLSYKMHVIKPSPAIFEQVLKESGIKAEETLFVDDSSANCETARELGIHAMNEKTGRDWMKMLGENLKAF